ncbi:MAG: hypothetical protein ACOCVB_01795 [Bacillota bacterium]
MRVLSKSDFMEKINADYGLGPKREEKLPLEMIDRVTSGVESEKDIVGNESFAHKKGDDIKARARNLAREINNEVSNQPSAVPDKEEKEYFEVDIATDVNIKGVRLKGHVGIEITGFKCAISTEANAAVYNYCEVYRGQKEDTFDVWGRYTGKLDKTTNNSDKAQFEFYLRGSNLTVTYWRSYQYQDKAKKMAVRAIEVLNKVFSQ